MSAVRLSRYDFHRAFGSMGADDEQVSYSDSDKSTLQKAKDLVLETETVRTQTDEMINRLTDPALRAKYVGKKMEIRSQFQKTVGDLVEKFLKLADEVKGFFAPEEKPKPATIFARVPIGKLGGYGSYEEEYIETEMGVLPLFGIAWLSTGAVKVAILALSVVIIAGATYFASKNMAEKDLQKEILNDTKLPVTDKVDLLRAIAGESTAGKIAPWLLLAGVGFFAWKMLEKR